MLTLCHCDNVTKTNMKNELILFSFVLGTSCTRHSYKYQSGCITKTKLQSNKENTIYIKNDNLSLPKSRHAANTMYWLKIHIL